MILMNIREYKVAHLARCDIRHWTRNKRGQHGQGRTGTDGTPTNRFQFQIF